MRNFVKCAKCGAIKKAYTTKRITKKWVKQDDGWGIHNGAWECLGCWIERKHPDMDGRIEIVRIST